MSMMNTVNRDSKRSAMREGHLRWMTFEVAADEECMERRSWEAAGERGGPLDSSFSSVFSRASKGVDSDVRDDVFGWCELVDRVDAGREFDDARTGESTVL
jgi:hypothetical protein